MSQNNKNKKKKQRQRDKKKKQNRAAGGDDEDGLQEKIIIKAEHSTPKKLPSTPSTALVEEVKETVTANNNTKTTTTASSSKKGQVVPSSSSSSPFIATNNSSNYYHPKNNNKLYMTPKDGLEFQNLIQQHYQGFLHVSEKDLTPTNFHVNAKAALERLRDANYYQYDIVKAGGKYSSRTFVKRCLVGDPGITYKYLGLRLFAHAWSGSNSGATFKAIYDMNQQMIHMTKSLSPLHGKCQYNLTLINYMEPTSHTKVGFKDEAYYGMGKVSVSWHADSSLEPNSSIGVYHCLPQQRKSKWDWRIGLRIAPTTSSSGGGSSDDNNPNNNNSHSEDSSIPPVVVDTKDGDAYFLLGTMNETHQHCVLAGSEANRISSTHRVAVTGEDTYQYILRRAKGALKRFRMQLSEIMETRQRKQQLDPKVMLFCQRVLTEIEMEWIAQYWLQGAEHDKMHVWWQQPMKTLETIWTSLEECTFELYQLIYQDAQQQQQDIPRVVVKGLLAEMTERQEKRQQWDERRAEKIYQRRISLEFRPVARPTFDDDNDDSAHQQRRRLGKDLSKPMEVLTQILEGRSKQKNKKTNTTSTNPRPADTDKKQATGKRPQGNGKRGISSKKRDGEKINNNRWGGRGGGGPIQKKPKKESINK